MTTLTSQYITGIRAALGAAADFPASIERSPVRAIPREDKAVLRVLPGREVMGEGSISCAVRVREIQIWVHSAGDDHVDLVEPVFEAAHPIIMRFQAPGLVKVEEGNTDEPRYADGDLTRQIVVKRYLLTYHTDEHSLSE